MTIVIAVFPSILHTFM